MKICVFLIVCLCMGVCVIENVYDFVSQCVFYLCVHFFVYVCGCVSVNVYLCIIFNLCEFVCKSVCLFVLHEYV